MQINLFGVVYNLFISPLRPEVPGKHRRAPKKSNHHKEPEKAVDNVEVSVKNVADSMDGATTGILLCCLGQRCFLEGSSHSFYSFGR